MNGKQIIEFFKESYLCENNKVFLICVTVVIVSLLLSFVVCLWRKMGKDLKLRLEKEKGEFEKENKRSEFQRSLELKDKEHKLYKERKLFDSNLAYTVDKEKQLVETVEEMKKTIDSRMAEIKEKDPDKAVYESLTKQIEKLKDTISNLNYGKLQ